MFLLVVYFAGFATAIYFLAPKAAEGYEGQTAAAVTPSQTFAIEFNGQMDKAIGFGKRAAERTGDLIREKMHENAAERIIN